MKLHRITGMEAFIRRLRIPRGCVKRADIHSDAIYVDARRYRRIRRQAR